MAYADYLHCAICDCKTIYDADVNCEFVNASDLITLCKNCGKTHIIAVLEKESGEPVVIEHADFLNDN